MTGWLDIERDKEPRAARAPFERGKSKRIFTQIQALFVSKRIPKSRQNIHGR
jgi:hypothetical protein